jgi:hypothetical protein
MVTVFCYTFQTGVVTIKTVFIALFNDAFSSNDITTKEMHIAVRCRLISGKYAVRISDELSVILVKLFCGFNKPVQMNFGTLSPL